MVRLMELMGIIIFEVKYESNECCFQELFLKELYPSGLVDYMLIGRLEFDCDNKFCVNFHTRQKPATEVEKLGYLGTKL